MERLLYLSELNKMTLDELNTKIAAIAAGVDALKKAQDDQIATLTAAVNAAAGAVAPQALDSAGAALDAIAAKLPAA